MADVDTPATLLSVRNLVVEFRTGDGVVHAVDDVSFDVAAGETLGVVGESGCGKSATALAILGLLPRPAARVPSGEVRFGGRDLLRLSRGDLRRIRGNDIAMVFQDPMTSMHPAFSVGDQIVEALVTHHERLGERAAWERAVSLLERVGVPSASHRAHDYPHQWSGGMRQRAMIAMAIANDPSLLIADEPTTALDVSTQAQVLDVLRVAQRDTGAATILISHDLGVIAELADRVAVMYAGRIVELGRTDDVFAAPRHPYTLGLLGSLPRLDGAQVRLVAVPGQPPDLVHRPSGCLFHPRCRLRRGRERCVDEVPALDPVGVEGRSAACHYAAEMSDEIVSVNREVGVQLTPRDS